MAGENAEKLTKKKSDDATLSDTSNKTEFGKNASMKQSKDSSSLFSPASIKKHRQWHYNNPTSYY